MHNRVVLLITVFSVFKGAVLAVATTALDIAFWKALVIAVIAAVIGAIGQTIGALIMRHYSRENRRRLEDVAGVIGADKRQADKDAG